MTVTRIEELSRSRCKIYLEDSFAFVLYKGELRLYGVREQEELSEESYREIMQEVLPKRATLRCMNLLQSRAYTESKLRSKLKEGGYPQESIDSALAYVKSYHYVDDLQFAKDYIVNQAGKKSRRVLEQDLIARGVSRDEIEAAFAEAAEKGDGPDELALAQMWLAKKRYDPAQADFAEKRKAAAFLYRKGISAETVRKAMELAGAQSLPGAPICAEWHGIT